MTEPDGFATSGGAGPGETVFVDDIIVIDAPVWTLEEPLVRLG